MSGRDDLVGGVIGGLTATDRARLVRGITIGALVGAAIAGSLLRARRRRPPRPVLRLGPTGERTVSAEEGTVSADESTASAEDGAAETEERASDTDGGAPETEGAPQTEDDGHLEAPAGTE